MTQAVSIKQELQVDDLFRAAELIGAAVTDMDPSLMREARQDEAAKYRLGVQMFQTAIRVAPEQGKAFVAGICDMSADDFGALPAHAMLDVLDQLAERSDLRDFFTRALDTARRFGLTNANENPVAQDSEPSKAKGPHGVTG